MAKGNTGNKNVSVTGGGKIASPSSSKASGFSTNANGTSVVVSDSTKSTIMNTTGTDRADVLNNVAKALGGSVGKHQVFTGSSNIVKVGDYIIDVVTRKKKNTQVVKMFFAYNKSDRKSMTMYM